jgi:hypothetical protein
MPPGKRLTRAEVFELFAKSDASVAKAAFAAAVKAIHLEGDSMSVEDALRLLETIAAEPEPIGVTARFAKARVLLRAAGGKL